MWLHVAVLSVSPDLLLSVFGLVLSESRSPDELTSVFSCMSESGLWCCRSLGLPASLRGSLAGCVSLSMLLSWLC